MDANQLPVRPNLEQFRKQAKELLKNRTSAEVLQRIKKFHPRLRELREDQLDTLSLADAQWVIAREHAFESWPKFVGHIRQMSNPDSGVARFELAADAIVAGDLAGLQRLLQENPELVRARSTRQHGAPLIHYVAANGVEGFRQKTPRNIVEITRALLSAGAEVDAITAEYGGASTALGLAATSYHPARAGVQLELLDLLLNAGAAVDGAPGGWNPLVAALHNGRGEAAVFLAQRGARLDLEAAAGAGRVDVLPQFVRSDGTLVQGATRQQMEDGFLWACEYGHTLSVEFLLDRGMKANDSFSHGATGLHWAAFGGHVEIVEILINRMAPIDLKDPLHGGTPLGWALYGWNVKVPEFRNSRYHESVERLVCAGAKPDWEWLESRHRGSCLAENLRANKEMMAALNITK